MDAQRFDDLARTLAARSGRRRFTAGLVGALLGAIGLGKVNAAQADGCPPCPQYCSQRMTVEGDCTCYQNGIPQICRADSCTSMSDCPSGYDCLAADCNDGTIGRCVEHCVSDMQQSSCPDGQELCDGSCTDVMNDVANCGSCGNHCGGGEIPVGHAWGCSAGQCELICADDADYCGSDCTDFAWDANNCGSCGNVCASGVCCGGVCREPSEAERYCGCGMYNPAFHQGCNADETCSEDFICVGAAEQPREMIVAAWVCTEEINMEGAIEPPLEAGNPHKSWDIPSCEKEDGMVFQLQDPSGSEIARCTTTDGICWVDIPADATVANVIILDRPDLTLQSEPSIGSGMAFLFYWPGEEQQETPATTAPELAKQGTLVYGARADGHWSIQSYDFATQQTTELANTANSDQFSPSYAHAGDRIAYLSDEVGAVNQVWVMDAAGGNKRQLSDFAGPGSITQVSWSSDDQLLFATVVDGEESRVWTMPSSGGSLQLWLDVWAGSPAVNSTGLLLLETMDGGRMAISTAQEDGSNLALFMSGDTYMSPAVAEGESAYVAFTQGAVGQRRVMLDRLTPTGAAAGVPYSGGDDGNPVFSPDHYFVSYVRTTNGQAELVTYRLDGGKDSAPIQTPAHDRLWYLSWRPQGGGSSPETPTHQATPIQSVPDDIALAGSPRWCPPHAAWGLGDLRCMREDLLGILQSG